MLGFGFAAIPVAGVFLVFLEIPVKDPTFRPAEMFHLFNSVYLGANMRWLAKAGYDEDELRQDVEILQWCMGQYKHEIQMDDSSCAGERDRLPNALAQLREKCTRKGFGWHIGTFDRLVKAVINLDT